MPATAAMTEPVEVVLRIELVTPEIAKEVVVALVVVARVVMVSVRPLRTARLFKVVVPARFVSNIPEKVVVYTPLVTVPALPEIEPVIV